MLMQLIDNNLPSLLLKNNNPAAPRPTNIQNSMYKMSIILKDSMNGVTTQQRL